MRGVTINGCAKGIGMAKQDEALFEESSQGAVSLATAVGFIFGLVLMLGGLLLLSYAFSSSLEPMVAMAMFAGGLVSSWLGFAIPFAFMGRSSR